jgi:hypothetical protein
MNKVSGLYIIDDKGQKTAAILPIRKYVRLLEDLHDLAVVAERRDEPTVTFAKLREKLKKNGCL